MSSLKRKLSPIFYSLLFLVFAMPLSSCKSEKKSSSKSTTRNSNIVENLEVSIEEENNDSTPLSEETVKNEDAEVEEEANEVKVITPPPSELSNTQKLLNETKRLEDELKKYGVHFEVSNNYSSVSVLLKTTATDEDLTNLGLNPETKRELLFQFSEKYEEAKKLGFGDNTNSFHADKIAVFLKTKLALSQAVLPIVISEYTALLILKLDQTQLKITKQNGISLLDTETYEAKKSSEVAEQLKADIKIAKNFEDIKTKYIDTLIEIFQNNLDRVRTTSRIYIFGDDPKVTLLNEQLDALRKIKQYSHLDSDDVVLAENFISYLEQNTDETTIITEVTLNEFNLTQQNAKISELASEIESHINTFNDTYGFTYLGEGVNSTYNETTISKAKVEDKDYSSAAYKLLSRTISEQINLFLKLIDSVDQSSVENLEYILTVKKKYELLNSLADNDLESYLRRFRR